MKKIVDLNLKEGCVHYVDIKSLRLELWSRMKPMRRWRTMSLTKRMRMGMEDEDTSFVK